MKPTHSPDQNYEISVPLAGAHIAELRHFLERFFDLKSRRTFAAEMIPPARGRIPTSEECKRLDALRYVLKALDHPVPISAEKHRKHLAKFWPDARKLQRSALKAPRKRG